MTVIAIIGFPFSGADHVVDEISAQGWSEPLTVTKLRAYIETSLSKKACIARDVIAAGRLLDDSLIATMWWEATPPSGAVIGGFPRTIKQLKVFESLARQSVCLVHVVTTKELVNERMAECGLRPVDQSHPGSWERSQSEHGALSCYAAKRGLLLELDGARPARSLANEVHGRFWEPNP